MQKVSKETLKGKAICELQGLQIRIATGAVAGVDIPVAGITKRDKIIAACNLTDLTDTMIAAAKAYTTAPLSPNYDGVIEATTAGAAGNDLTVSFEGDDIAGVRIERTGNHFLIRYQSGVSTVAQVNTAITALAGLDNLIVVKTAGTVANVLTAPDSNCVATFLVNGYDANTEEPTISSDGNIKFATLSTAAKKIQIFFIPGL